MGELAVEEPSARISFEKMWIGHEGIKDQCTAGREMSCDRGEASTQVVILLQMQDRIRGDDDQPKVATCEIEVPHIDLHELDIDVFFGCALAGMRQHGG